MRVEWKEELKVHNRLLNGCQVGSLGGSFTPMLDKSEAYLPRGSTFVLVVTKREVHQERKC